MGVSLFSTILILLSQKWDIFCEVKIVFLIKKSAKLDNTGTLLKRTSDENSISEEGIVIPWNMTLLKFTSIKHWKLLEELNKELRWIAHHMMLEPLLRTELKISPPVYVNGVGFDLQLVTTGSGFENIHTRISPFYGKILIDSSSKTGTEIIIEIERS